MRKEGALNASQQEMNEWQNAKTRDDISWGRRILRSTDILVRTVLM
jgi:hypothetical protein